MMRKEETVRVSGPRPDPRAPGIIVLRQAAKAMLRSVRGEQAVILRVEAGRKVIRGDDRDGTVVDRLGTAAE
jgi:hypothetical protein